MDLKLKDFIADGEVQKLIELDGTIDRVRATYVSVAKELAKGLKINVEGIEDLERITFIYNTQVKKTAEANAQLIDAGRKQEEIVHKVADAISKTNIELGKENSKKQESYQVDKKALDIAKDILGSRGQNLEQLIKLESELKSISEAQKKLNEAEKNGDITGGALLKKREALVERERTLKVAKSELNTVLTREEKLSHAAVGSYDEMSHSLELMKRAYKQMNDAEKSGSNGRILASEIQKADKELKEISASMGEFQRNVGNYTGALNNEYAPAIKNALGLNNTFADSLLKLSEAGEAGGGFFENLSTKTKAFGNTLLTLLKNPVFLSIAGIAAVGTAFKFWYDYNKGLVEASRLTTQFTGLHGDEMKQYRNEVQAVADTFEVDFKETLIAANAVSKQFGISANDSLKLIKDGFIAGANANGEFLENLKEYPAYFKEAGVSAKQFIAITAQANKAGIYSDKGVDVIKEGNLRIREMTAATAEALDGIGISSKKVLEELRKGETTTFEVMRKVSEKLNELPDSSSAVGTAIADIFGGPGEDAGLQYIRTLKDIEMNLDNVKAAAGDLGRAEEDLVESQARLASEITLLFDKTGGSFEGMTSKIKTFANEVLADIIKEVRELTESVDDVYSRRYNSARKEGRTNGENAVSKEYAHIQKLQQMYIEQGLSENEALKKAKDAKLKILRQSLKEEGELLQQSKNLYDSSKQGYENYKSNSLFGNDYGRSLKERDMNDALDEYIKKLSIISSLEAQISGIEKFTPASTGTAEKTADELKREEDERKKAAEEAKKKLAIRQELEDSKIELMDEGLEKELAKIKQGYLKRIDAITGNSNAEKAIKLNLQKKMQDDLQKYQKEYERQYQLKNVENQLSVVKKGTEEELNLRLKQLEIQHHSEIESARKTGEDVSLIDEKYARKKQELYERYASEQVKMIADNAGYEQILRDKQYQEDMTAATRRYANNLKSGMDSAEAKKKYEKEKYQITLDYTRKTTEAAIDALEMQLNAEKNLGPGERAKIAEELQKLKVDLAKQEAEAEIDAIENVTKADEKAQKARLKNLDKWLQMASQAIGAIGDLVSTVYDGQIEKIEEEQDLNDEKYDKDVERIEKLAENGAISEEEAEARKRAAKMQTEAKNTELERKKQEIQHKQAVWDKAVQVSQTGIATARGIMEALAMIPPNPVMAAMIGAMGAVQVATILATPIPSYAEGTKDNARHRGGTALVGDAGRREVVMYNGLAWITPDTPTLVDLPAGAQVFPDVDKIDISDFDFPNWNLPFSPQNVSSAAQNTVIFNDYSRLEKRVDRTNYLLQKSIKQQHDDANNRDFENYKRWKMS
ncbi:phage tail tape measure protein [Bacteroides bouchesdurhonensis]|uniref:phage tail tape measure protein n=1 Tax=Bacteroides bouchesdurhonensis TaxID=1841855 RepID=UPI0022E58BB7|nr:phage tail tape measure protein [Bacteroides bouchesdurhonensis]